MVATLTEPLDITADRRRLVAAVAAAAAVVPAPGRLAATTAPYRSGLLLDAHDGILAITGASDDAVVTAAVPTAGTSPHGRVVVPGALFADLISQLPTAEADVRLTRYGNGLRVTCGTLTFAVIGPEDTPVAAPPSPAPAGEVDGEALAAAVTRIAPAASRDAAPAELTGIRLDWDTDTLALVATNSYRIAVETLPWAGAPDSPADGTALVPATALRDATRALAGPVTLALGPGQLALTADDTRVGLRLLAAARFPAYRRLTTQTPIATARVDTKTMTAALRRARTVLAPTDPLWLDAAPGRLVLSVESGQSAALRLEQVIDADCAGPDDMWPQHVALNPAYLSTALHTSYAVTVFGFFRPNPANNRPRMVAVDGEESTHRQIIMPIQRP